MTRLLVLLLLLAVPALAAAPSTSSSKPANPIIPFAPAKPPAPLPTTIGSGMALEGDLISVNGSAVKLWGIDAPDAGQTCQTRSNQPYDCFNESKNVLSNIIGQNQVTCYIRGKDRNGQSVGTCAVNDLDLAALMVRDGWALAYADLSPQYVDLEGVAQARNRGLWSGRVEPPWRWRSRTAASRNK